MGPADVILLNAREVRRRSEIAWRGIPPDALQWKPDPAAMSAIEMVRHVLEGEYLYMLMALERRSVSEDRSPFAGRPFVGIADELAFAAPFRKEFEQMVGGFADDDFDSIVIDRSDVGYQRRLGDFLLRAIYHEAVHCGQLLGYLRTMGVPRPKVWD
jgi:uncharacterized damage-inducible protein DinB